MNGRIGRNDASPSGLGGPGPAAFDDYGLGNPAATCHTPRPGEGRDGDTGRLNHGRWCL